MPKSVIIPAGSSAPLAPFVPGTLAVGNVRFSSLAVKIDLYRERRGRAG